MNKKGYTMIELLILIIGMGIVTAIVLATTSYSLKDHSDEYYDQKVHAILRQAESYAKTLDNLKEEKNLVITVNDLVESGYYVADSKDNKVSDPRNSKANLNAYKIKITYEDDGKIKASMIEED